MSFFIFSQKIYAISTSPSSPFASGTVFDVNCDNSGNQYRLYQADGSKNYAYPGNGCFIQAEIDNAGVYTIVETSDAGGSPDTLQEIEASGGFVGEYPLTVTGQTDDVPTDTPTPQQAPLTPTLAPGIEIINNYIQITPTPTPTPIPDRVSPSVQVDTDLSKPFLNSPKITGTAKDNKAVTKVEYSLDGGKNWLPVDNLSSSGKSSTNFDFVPPVLDDGNYDLRVRATDPSSNVGTSNSTTIIIDRLAPGASGEFLSLGPQVITPRKDGVVLILSNQVIKISLSDVGGATGVFVSAVNLQNNISQTFSLVKNIDSGLWSSDMLLSAGEYQLKVAAIDGAKNRTERNLNKIMVIGKGEINNGFERIHNAKITVYYQDPETKVWQIWDGSPYSQANPQLTDENGNYSLFLPAGKYYFQIEAAGFTNSNSEFFTLDQTQPINANFSLKPLKTILSAGFVKIYYPNFSVNSIAFINNLPNIYTSDYSLLEKQAPYFSLANTNKAQISPDFLKGKPTIITFINTWSPSSLEQVSILNRFSKNKDFNIQIVVEGEKSSKVSVFQKRGGYGLSIIPDSDATLVASYGLNVLPVSYFIDRSGIVKNIISGTLNEQELANMIMSITQ